MTWTKRRYRQWLQAQRSLRPALRADEVSDDEVVRLILAAPPHYAGVTFHASSTQSGDISGASNTTVTITKPTVSAGDILTATFGINQGTTAGTFATPTGWTLIGASITSTKVRVYAFVALQSVAGLAFTYTSGLGGGSISWECLSFSGVDNTTPIDVAGTGSSNTGVANITPGNYTTATDGALPMWSICDWNAASTFTSTGFTVVATSNAANCQVSTGYRTTTFSPAGPYTSIQISDGASATGQILCVQQYALRPAAAAGGPWPWFLDQAHAGGMWEGGL